MGEEEEEVTVTYALTSGGSAIVETLFAGTPKEMVSVYYDQKGELIMTHYCMLGNQPRLGLKAVDPANMKFDLIEGSGIDVQKEPHMHTLVLSFESKDRMTQKWTLFEEGKAKETTAIHLTRAVQGGFF